MMWPDSDGDNGDFGCDYDSSDYYYDDDDDDDDDVGDAYDYDYYNL